MKRRILDLSLIPLVGIMALLMILLVSSASADGGYPEDYAADRAQIKDLMGRYMFALDFNDAEGFAALFAEDAKFIPGPDQDPLSGRTAILKDSKKRGKRFIPKPDAKEMDKEWIPAHRHFLSNLVIKVDGDRAYGNAVYGHFKNTGDDRKAELISYGLYTDEYVKVIGRWFFSSRKWNNETREGRYTPASNAFINPTPSPY